MFAVLKTGGKQYKVAVNDIVTLEKLPGEAGDEIEFDQVLMLGGDTLEVGAPMVAGASVKGEVLEQFRGEKVISFKKRRRKHSSKTTRGHRQYLTRVRITDILGNADSAKKDKKAAAAKDDAPMTDAPSTDAARTTDDGAEQTNAS